MHKDHWSLLDKLLWPLEPKEFQWRLSKLGKGFVYYLCSYLLWALTLDKTLSMILDLKKKKPVHTVFMEIIESFKLENISISLTFPLGPEPFS